MEKKYFKLRLKSAFRVYPTILIVTLITIISIVTTCFLLLQTNNVNNEKQKISLGVVGDLEDTYLEIGIHALKNIDNTRFFLDIHEMTESEAIEALEKRTISGYVHIPQDYVENILWGKNNPARYITLNTPEGFGTIISSEIAEIVSGIVVESQNGMYSMQNLAKDYNIRNLNKKFDTLMLSYVDSILNRNEMYDFTNLGISDGLSFAGYYICGFLLLLTLLWGISCNRIFSSYNIEYNRLLNISGMKSRPQVVCEYLAYLTITTITLLLFATVFGIVLQFFDLDIPELIGVRVIDCIFFILKVIPVIIMITLIQTVIYEFIQNYVAAILVQFILAIVFGYISGCFYPNYFFPETVQKIAEILPVGIGFSYIRKIMSGSIPVLDFCVISIYITVFFSITVCIRKYRISGGIR